MEGFADSDEWFMGAALLIERDQSAAWMRGLPSINSQAQGEHAAKRADSPVDGSFWGTLASHLYLVCDTLNTQCNTYHFVHNVLLIFTKCGATVSLGSGTLACRPTDGKHFLDIDDLSTTHSTGKRWATVYMNLSI